MLRTRLFVASLGSALAVGAPGPAVAQVPEAATIGSNLIIKVRLLNPAPSAKAFASVVLLAGGNGVLNLTAAGDVRELSGNFLIRSARQFADFGLNVVMLDAEPLFAGPAGLTNQRHTKGNNKLLGGVIDAVRKQWKGKPVWLVGTSNGTISAVNAAGNLKGADLPNGIVLTSSVTAPDPAGELHFVTEAGLGLDKITVPTLVLWHQKDTCPFSHESAAANVFSGLSGVLAPKKGETKLSGGAPNVAMSACSAFGFHGFNGQEKGAVAVIAKFIKLQSSK
jgi:hypothetical protein